MYFENIIIALINIYRSEDLLQFLLNVDRLGNAICGGDPYNTVSGRVGYFAFIKNNVYWNSIESIIDLTFLPLDGPNHCFMAYQYEKTKPSFKKYRRSSDLALIALAFISAVVCFLIAPFVFLYANYRGYSN